MNIDLLTATPHRLRFSVSGKVDDSTAVITNAQLVAAALEPLRTILQGQVTNNDDARLLLLGVGVPGDPFISPQVAIQPVRYCRVRVEPLRVFPFNIGVTEQLAVDAAFEVGNRAQLQLAILAADAEWILDLSVEHTLIR